MFTDDAIALLNEKFVPFTPVWGEASKDSWYEAARKKTFQGQGEGALRGTTMWLVTSAGQILPGDARKGMAQGLQEILETYAKLPESERRPSEPIKDENRPMPAPPAGGLVLTVYDRPLIREGEGRYRAGKPEPSADEPDPFWGPFTPQREALWLTEAEWKALLPANPRKGETYPVPSRLTKRLFLLGLWPHALWVVKQGWTPASVQKGELQLLVEEVSTQAVRLRVSGSAFLVAKAHHPGSGHPPIPEGLENRYDAQLEGVLVYDPAQKRIVRWDMAALGEYTGISRASRSFFTTQPLPLGFSFELDQSDYEVPAERRRAKSYLLGYVFQRRNGGEQHYWDPDQWLEYWKQQPKP